MLSDEAVQATFLVAPGLSAMLFRLTKESWSSHALLDAKLLLTDFACAGSTYSAAALAAVGDCMEHKCHQADAIVHAQR